MQPTTRRLRRCAARVSALNGGTRARFVVAETVDPCELMHAVSAEAPVARAALHRPAGRPLLCMASRPPRNGAAALASCCARRSATSTCRPTRRCEFWRSGSRALGFDMLRLDYDGTGNSAGEHEDPDRVGGVAPQHRMGASRKCEAWPGRPVALVGFRAGAILALHAAAASGGVERLVLWSPFASGRAYVRELKAIARLRGKDDASDDQD